MQSPSPAWPFSRVETTLLLDPCGDDGAVKLALARLAGYGFQVVAVEAGDMLGAKITLIRLASHDGEAVLQASAEDGVELICPRPLAEKLDELAISTSISTGIHG